MLRKPLIGATGALALFACDRPAEPAPSPAGETPPPTAEIAAIDEFGPFSRAVSGAAFWVHPTVAFNSLAIVAGDMGLVALNIEDGEPVAAAGGWPARGVSLFYEEGADGEAAAGVRGVVVSADATAGAFRFFEIDNALRTLNERRADGAPTPGAAFCAGGGADGPARLALFVGSAIEIRPLSLGADGVSVGAAARAELPRPGVDCAIDPRTGDAFALLSDGRIARAAADGSTPEILFSSGAVAPIALGLAVNSLDQADDAGGGEAAGDAPSGCCARLFTLDAADASLRVFDLENRRMLGSVRLISSFDVEGVSAASAAGIGSGNYGGVYRDGVVALATGGARPVLRLAPLAGVLEALGPGSGPALNPREAASGVHNQSADQDCAGDGFDPVDPAACTKLAPVAMPDFAPASPQ